MTTRSKLAVWVGLPLCALATCGYCTLDSLREDTWAVVRPVSVANELTFSEPEQRIYVHRGSGGLARYLLASRRLQLLFADRWMLADLPDDEHLLVLKDQDFNVALAAPDGSGLRVLPKLVSHWGSPAITRDGSQLAVPREPNFDLPEDQRWRTAVSDIYVFDTATLTSRVLQGERGVKLGRIDWSDDEQSILAETYRKGPGEGDISGGLRIRVSDNGGEAQRYLDVRRAFDQRRVFSGRNCPNARVDWSHLTLRVVVHGKPSAPIRFEHVSGGHRLFPIPELSAHCGYALYPGDGGLWLTQLSTGKSRRILEGWYTTGLGVHALSPRRTSELSGQRSRP